YCFQVRQITIVENADVRDRVLMIHLLRDIVSRFLAGPYGRQRRCPSALGRLFLTLEIFEELDRIGQRGQVSLRRGLAQTEVRDPTVESNDSSPQIDEELPIDTPGICFASYVG